MEILETFVLGVTYAFFIKRVLMKALILVVFLQKNIS